ncbi:MAG TPA: hypothetical protein VK466_07835 [Terriglobales bacterium]|nr:hypothetical protein [Terriglobales bacterium]
MVGNQSTIEMISQAAVEYLSGLKYRADAEQMVSLIPLSGIYWEDEIDFAQLHQLSEQDQHHILWLFGIRKKIWKSEVLNSSDQKFWQATRNLVPHCPLFWRVDPSPDVIRADACIERELDVFEEHLFEHADHASVTQDEHGVRRVTATFVLKKEPSASRKRARWKILFRRGTDGA